MKILFLTPWYPDDRNPNHGVFVRNQALLINRQHEVWVVSAKIDYTRFAVSAISRNDSTFEGMRESRLLVKRSLPVYNQFNFFLRVTRATLKIARELKPDIIHGNIGYPGAFWAWLMSRLLDVPFVMTEHTRIVNNFRSSLHKRLTLLGLRKASAIIGVSRWHADEIADFVGKNVEVIPNVISFEKLPKTRIAPTTMDYQIGFLGGLNTPVKGLDILLHAAAALPNKFKLHIGGDGTLLPEYKKLAEQLHLSDHCVFYGAISHEEIYSFMQRLHIFVSASRSETFGIAMVEALACGVPVVATDSGGSREFITPQNGLLVEIDPEHLAEGIERLMSNFRAYDATIIRNSVVEKFSDRRFLDEIEKIYDRAL
jgi:glycosyltransferase involved in cell wall biosynthesis